MDPTRTKHILEACLLVAARPMSVPQLEALFEGDEERPTRDGVREALAALGTDYEGRGIELVEVASGFRLQSRIEVQRWVSRLFQERTPRYSRALLETLVLVAYRQPITRGEIEEVRGVAVSSNIVRTLQERQWVREVGYKDVPGKPALLGTTRQFLDYFNLKRLEDLPTLGELKDLDAFDAVLAETGIVDGAADGRAANDAGDGAVDGSGGETGHGTGHETGGAPDGAVDAGEGDGGEADDPDDAAPADGEAVAGAAGTTDDERDEEDGQDGQNPGVAAAPVPPAEEDAPGSVGLDGAADEHDADPTDAAPNHDGLVVDGETIDFLLDDSPAGSPDDPTSDAASGAPAPGTDEAAGTDIDDADADANASDGGDGGGDGGDDRDDRDEGADRAGPTSGEPPVTDGGERPYEDPRAALLRVIERFGAEHRRDLEARQPPGRAGNGGGPGGGSGPDADEEPEARAADPSVSSVPAEPPDRNDRVP